MLAKESVLDCLAPAEREVADMLMQGLSLRDISELRARSYNTCRNQLAAVHLKLGTRSVAQIFAKFGRAPSM